MKSNRKAVMRLFYGLIIVFISAYITEEISPFIADVNYLFISKSIINYMLRCNREYFRPLNREFITGFIRE
jgi:hypothetical protein